MSTDHTFCASSPRAGAVGLCKALKEMKSKVALHTGVSLSFVELVATSPVVGLLPALPPSPRSPSALLHRHMHLHSNYTRRSSSADQSTCADMENMSRQSKCADGESEVVPNLCATDEDSKLEIKLSCMRMPCNASYGCIPSTCQVCHIYCENPSSCNLSCEHPSSSACSSSCGHQSSSSAMCVSSCGQTSSSSSSSMFCSCHLSCGHPSSYSSCNFYLSSSSSTCNLSSWHPSSSPIACYSHLSSSTSTCNSPCEHPSFSSSYDLTCGQSSCDLSCGHQSSSSSSSLSSPYDFSSGHPSSSSSISSSNHCCTSAKLGSDMPTLPDDKLSSDNVDCYDTFCASSTGMCKHTTKILQVESQIPSTSSRVLYLFVTFIFALSSMSKSFCKWGRNISRLVLCLHILMHHIRVMVSTGSAKANREYGGHGSEMEGMKLDMNEGEQCLQRSKTSCMKRSKLLKSKLRSSFKSLSVQVPRKAFAPLHFNTLPHASSSSTLSSLSSASPLSSNSPVINGSPISKKTRTLRSPAFARKLTKSFNQRQPSTISQISLISPTNPMWSSSIRCMVFSHPSSREVKQHSPSCSTSWSKLGDSMVVPLVTLPLALCALFYGKLVAFIVVTAWLLIILIASNASYPWRTSPQMCSPQ